jgi:hypothetical protein
MMKGIASKHATLTSIIISARGLATWAQGGQDNTMLLNQFHMRPEEMQKTQAHRKKETYMS